MDRPPTPGAELQLGAKPANVTATRRRTALADGSVRAAARARLGAAALARPLDAPGFIPAAAAAAAVPLVALGLAWHGRLGRLAGFVLVAAYVAFFVSVLR